MKKKMYVRMDCGVCGLSPGPLACYVKTSSGISWSLLQQVSLFMAKDRLEQLYTVCDVFGI